MFRAGGKQSAKGWGNRKGQQGFKAQFPAAWSLVQCTDICGNHRLGAKTPDRTCRTNHQQFRLFKTCLGKPNKFQQLKIIYTLNLLFWPKKKQGWIFVIHSHPSSLRSIIPHQGSPIESLSRATPQKERIIDSNHPFSGAEMLVSGSVLSVMLVSKEKQGWPTWIFASTGDPNRIQLWIDTQTNTLQNYNQLSIGLRWDGNTRFCSPFFMTRLWVFHSFPPESATQQKHISVYKEPSASVRYIKLSIN